MEKLPEQYQSINKRFKPYLDAVNNLGQAARNAGPLDGKTCHLIQLAAAAAVRSEGSLHSHTRRALEAGATAEELHHAVILTTSIIGFPTVSAALSCIDDTLKKQEG